MSMTYFRTDDAVVTISDEAVRRNESEQRQRQAEILMWTVTASVVTIAGLVLNRLIGA